MMWNYLIAGLSRGTRIVLYDGSPLHDVILEKSLRLP
jgi:hypothetical protein